jgi:hypothetical protein
MPDTPSPSARNNPVVFTSLITLALAAAVLTGASLSGVAGGAVHDLLRNAGFGRHGEILAEQRRQAQALEKIELSVSRARADMALLNARVDEAENLYQEAVNAVPVGSVPNNPVPGNPPQSGPEFDFGALRASFEEETERNRNEFRAVNKRLDWLEKVIYRPGGVSQPAAPARRHGSQLARGWRVLHAAKGVAVISGKDGAIDVTPGFTVPDLGRVAAIRQEHGRWVVVTENGTTIRER